MKRQATDFASREAKVLQYRSRAAFKLMEVSCSICSDDGNAVWCCIFSTRVDSEDACAVMHFQYLVFPWFPGNRQAEITINSNMYFVLNL